MIEKKIFLIFSFSLNFSKRLFFFTKKEPKTLGRSDSPQTPNGQGR
jgi:hypothetical protein